MKIFTMHRISGQTTTSRRRLENEWHALQFYLGWVPVLVVMFLASQHPVLGANRQAASDRSTVLEFDGIDDRVTVPYNASFPTEVFTAGAWIKLTQPTRRAAIIARGEDDNSFNLSWQLYVSGEGNLEIMLEDSRENNYCYPFNNCAPMGTCTITGDLFVADDAWHHAAVTRNSAAQLVIYIDGESRASCEGTGVPSSNNFQDLSIGCTYGAIGPPPGGVEPPVWFLQGQIDDPAMWNVALTNAEITDVFTSGVDPLSPGLVGYWTFDEGMGQALADLSSAQNDGFLGEFSTSDSADPLWLNAEATGVKEGSVPGEAGAFLEPNYPNPFRNSTAIRFSLPRPEYIRVIVFDLLGQPIATLADGQYDAGRHAVIFDGSSLPGGVYLYRLETPNGQQAGKLLHVR